MADNLTWGRMSWCAISWICARPQGQSILWRTTRPCSPGWEAGLRASRLGEICFVNEVTGPGVSKRLRMGSASVRIAMIVPLRVQELQASCGSALKALAIGIDASCAGLTKWRLLMERQAQVSV